MEVHHHTHTARKKWTHYFWEFLMLFLAVFAGFLAENQREHYVENKREKQYIRSLVQDLKEDTAYLKVAMNTHELSCKMIDTLIVLLNENKPKDSVKKIYYLARIIPFRDQAVLVHDKSFEQLKNSGSLRLIHKQFVLDSLSRYYEKYKWVSLGPSVMEIRNRQELFLSLEKLFDMSVFQEMTHSPDPFTPVYPLKEPKLLSNDMQVINAVCARYHFMYGTKKVLQSSAMDLLAMANNLLRLLQDEYDLK
jgi:hypothetical protein